MKFNLIVDDKKEEQVFVTVKKETDFIQKIEALVMEYNGTDKIIAFNEDDMIFLSFDEIECITVFDGKTYAITCKGETFRIKSRLYEMESVVPLNFIKINKSTIANRLQLKRFSATFSGGVDAVFKSGRKEYVSRRCFAEIKRRFISK